MFDDPTGIQDSRKQEALNTVLFNIEQMLKHGEEDNIISEDISNISLEEIHAFLLETSHGQNTDIKLFKVTWSNTVDPEAMATLYDYADVTPPNANIPNVKVYFLESKEFALTFIPIRGEKNIRIDMRPLESSPDFVKDMYFENKRGKRIEDIPFVKLTSKKKD